MNIIFVWTGVTGYMGDCWRALTAIPEVKLKIWVEDAGLAKDARFNAVHELRDLDCTVLSECGATAQEEIIRSMKEFRPDILFLVGWHAKTPRFFAECPKFRSIQKVIVFDLPFFWTLRKLLAPVVLFRYLTRFVGAFVPGAAASRYARWLGFGSAKRPIFTGLFSTNLKRFNGLAEKKIKEGVPKRFLYVGRYVPEKDLGTLVRAYGIYRKMVEDPWPLDCVGMGPDENWLKDQPGITDCGFCNPDDLPGIYASHGVFVLPSKWEPWGVVLAEAAGAGLPIICTDSCGARHEVVGENGIICATGDPYEIAEAMLKMHQASREEMSAMIREGVKLAQPYSCEAWAERVVEVVKKVLGVRG